MKKKLTVSIENDGSARCRFFLHLPQLCVMLRAVVNQLVLGSVQDLHLQLPHARDAHLQQNRHFLVAQLVLDQLARVLDFFAVNVQAALLACGDSRFGFLLEVFVIGVVLDVVIEGFDFEFLDSHGTFRRRFFLLLDDRVLFIFFELAEFVFPPTDSSRDLKFSEFYQISEFFLLPF